MTAQLDITSHNFVESDTITLGFTFRDSDGVLFDFSTVSKVWFTAKSLFSQDDADAAIGPLNSTDDPTQITYGAGGPGAGQVKVILIGTDTAGLAAEDTLNYDLQILQGADTISTLVRGKLSFVPEVTRATS